MNSRHELFIEKDYELIAKYNSMPNIKEDNPDSWLYGLGVFLFSTIGVSTVFFACLSIIGVP